MLKQENEEKKIHHKSLYKCQEQLYCIKLIFIKYFTDNYRDSSGNFKFVYI